MLTCLHSGHTLRDVLLGTGPYWAYKLHLHSILCGLPFRTTTSDGTIVGLLPHLPNQHFAACLLPKQGNLDSELANTASEVLWRLFAVWGHSYVVTKYVQRQAPSTKHFTFEFEHAGLVEYCFSGQKMFFQCRDGGATFETVLDIVQPQHKQHGKGTTACHVHP